LNALSILKLKKWNPSILHLLYLTLKIWREPSNILNKFAYFEAIEEFQACSMAKWNMVMLFFNLFQALGIHVMSCEKVDCKSERYSMSEVFWVIKIKWDIITTLSVPPLFHWIVIILQDKSPLHDAFISWQEFRNLFMVEIKM